MITTRRDFIKLAATAALTSDVASARFFTPASTPIDGIVNIGGRRELMVDDQLIASTRNVGKFINRPEKSIANPVLVPDRPWETEGGEPGGYSVGITSVIYDDEEKVFKAWYLTHGSKQRNFCCYAVSTDGVHFEKPELGLYDYNGSKHNNIWSTYDDPTYTEFMKDTRDPDPQRRYKAMGEWERSPIANTYGGVAVAFSPDGLRWTPSPENPVIHHGPNLADAPSMMGWDPLRRKYVCYPRPGHPMAPEIDGAGFHRHVRTVGYAESDDFVHWTPTRPMLMPGPENRIDFEFERFSAVVHDGFYFGAVPVRQDHLRVWGTYLLSSRDGFHWNWIDPQRAFLERGEIGSYDGSGAGVNCVLVHDGKLWMYYNGSHYRYRPSVNIRPERYAQGAACVATCPVNRCVGLMAALSVGVVHTRPVIFEGRALQVDLEPAVPVDLVKALARANGENQSRGFDDGEVRIAICDQSGGPLEKFTADRCRPLGAVDGVQQVVWEGADVGSLAGKPVRLQFELRNAALYGFQFV